MSAAGGNIDVVTQFVLQTAAARGELTDYVADVLRKTEQINQARPVLSVTLTPLDTQALDSMLVQLQTRTVEIPVRFVTEGSFNPADVANTVRHQAQTAGGVPVGQPGGGTIPVPEPTLNSPEVERAYAAAQQAGVTGDIYRMSARGMTEREIAGELGGRIPRDETTSRADFVRNVRTATGIPSQEDAGSFTAWQNEYRQRANGSPSMPPPPPPDSGPGAGAAPDPVRAAANQTVDQADDLSPMIARLTESVTDAAHELEDFAVLVAGTNESLRGARARGGTGRGRSRPVDDDEDGPGPPPPPKPKDDDPPGEAGPYGVTGDIYDLKSDRTAAARRGRAASRSAQEQQERDDRAASLRALQEGRRRGDLENEVAGAGDDDRNGSGYDGGPPRTADEEEAAAAKKGGAFSDIRRALRMHPSLGRFLGSFGALYAGEKFFKDAVGIADAGYGKRPSELAYDREQAIRDSVGSIPFLGTLANGVNDFVSAGLNGASGQGFVSTSTLNKYTIEQAGVRDQTSRQNLANSFSIQRSGTYNNQELIESRRREGIAKLNQELDQDQYKTPEQSEFLSSNTLNVIGAVSPSAEAILQYFHRDAVAGGKRNSIGKAKFDSDKAEIDAQTARESRDLAFENESEDATTAVNARQARREGRSNLARSNLQFGRQAQLDDALASIDENLDRQRAAKIPVIDNDKADPRERDRVKVELDAAEVKATKDREAAKTEAIRRATLENSQIVSDTAVATTRASGDAYTADRIAFEESWRQKLATEQDGNKRVLLERQKAAEESAREYEKSTRIVRQTNMANSILEERTNGQEVQAQRDEVADDARTFRRNNGLLDKNGAIISRDQLPADRQRLFDTIAQQVQNRYTAIEKQQRYGTEDVERQAEQKEGALAGDRYGATDRSIREREDRDLKENQDQTPEGGRRRAAIRRAAGAERAANDRERRDEILGNNVSGQQSEDRIRGQFQLASARGEVVDIGKQIRDARGDPERLRSVIGSAQSRLREQMMGSRRSEMFSSVEEYANNRFTSAANNDSTAYQALGGAATELKELAKLSGGNNVKFAKAVDMFLKKLGTF